MVILRLVRRPDGARAGVLHRRGHLLLVEGPDGLLRLRSDGLRRLRVRRGDRELVPNQPVPRRVPGARRSRAGRIDAPQLHRGPRRRRRGRGGGVEVRGLARGGGRRDGPGPGLCLGLGPRLAGPPRGHRARGGPPTSSSAGVRASRRVGSPPLSSNGRAGREGEGGVGWGGRGDERCGGGVRGRRRAPREGRREVGAEADGASL